MRRPVTFGVNKAMDLGLDQNTNYIITKWYGSSLAIFEEKAFQKYISKLDTDFSDSDHGRSVIRYFLSAAVTMVTKDEEGCYVPDQLLECIQKDGEAIESWHCQNPEKYKDSFPMIILASSSDMEHAIEMTVKRH